MVLGKHTFRARYLAERIARELGNALGAPVLPFAPTGLLMRAGDVERFPGTINLPPEIFSVTNLSYSFGADFRNMADYFVQGMQAFRERFHSIPQPSLPDSSVQNWRVPSPFPPHGIA